MDEHTITGSLETVPSTLPKLHQETASGEDSGDFAKGGVGVTKYIVHHIGMQYPTGFDSLSDRSAVEWALEDAKRHNLVVAKVKNFINGEIIYENPKGKEEAA